MDLNEQNKISKEYNSQNKDFTDVTILGTPIPQASSTVDRRSLLQGKNRRFNFDEQSNKYRQLNFDYANASRNSEESLGIIQNISSLLDDGTLDYGKNMKDSLELERERARKLLLKCNEPLNVLTSRSDKENNVNSSNVQRSSKIYSCSPTMKSIVSTTRNQGRNELQNVDCDVKSTCSSSIVFEPNEISARSSEVKTSEISEPFPVQDFDAISYNSNVAELMAQFDNEDFVSGSKAGSQLLADEISWRRNQSALPKNANSNEKALEFSCFSGIIGSDVDLTVDNGRVSIGEFFKQKCGGTGRLSVSDASDKPNLGFDLISPKKRNRLRQLNDDTITTATTTPAEESYGKECKSADCTNDQNVMSVTSIAKVLEGIDSATPGKLVEQILDANKKNRKQKPTKTLVTSETYSILPSVRTSLPVSATPFSNKIEKDTTQSTYRKKLSLDSKAFSYIDDASEIISGANLKVDNNKKYFVDSMSEMVKQPESKKKPYFYVSKPNSENFTPSVLRAEQSSIAQQNLSLPSTLQNKITNDSLSINNDTSLIHDTGPDINTLKMSNADSMIKEDITLNPVENYSLKTRKVEIGEKTQELCTCLVGIPKEADFELYNGTDRWILCGIKLLNIQGEKDNIELNLPNENILVEPDARKCFKIFVKMPHMGKLTIVNLLVPCQDMVTRTSWNMKHLMCFVPEEPDIRIYMPSEEDSINFQTITEDTSTSLPLTLENRNSIDIPIILQLYQDKPELFSVSDCFDDTVNSTHNQRVPVCYTLKPKQPLTINLDFKGMSLQSFGAEALRKGLRNCEGRLKVSICFKENEEYFIKEIPLKGLLGSSKLDILETQFPMVLQPRVARLMNLKNSGSIAVSATVDIVQSKDNQIESRDFFICPNNIVLNGSEHVVLQIAYKPENNKTDIERHAMIRIIVGNKVSFYPIVGERGIEYEPHFQDNCYPLQRCDTPQGLRSINSPTSPHSLIFNRSGTSGRHSPGSTASGASSNASIVVPIRASHIALVWGSIKVGKSDTKKLTIRNTSNSKVKLLAAIKEENHSFKFLKDNYAMVSSVTISLQGMESKTLSIVFAPNFARPCSGKIIFSHYSSIRENQPITALFKVVRLFGHGGCGKLEISEVVKDPSGQMWLFLGKLNAEGIMHGKFKLHNNGDLTCFSKIKIAPKALYPSASSSWHVEPTELLLAPNQNQLISFEFRPRKDDLVNVNQSSVIHIGTLKIIHGDEPTRLRIRRLYNKLRDSGQLNDAIGQQGDEFTEVIRPISKAFSGETVKDLKMLGDSVQNLGDLCKGVTQIEIKLTVEVHPDDTISMIHDNIDDSQIFYSLYSDHDDSNLAGESFLPAE